ncbi:ATP-binding protein [Enemella dayhoffiae]|uniref:ATP-binding protein n=1 Tax=Enemella dayhoffiae TaxID=2016507 RepID=A0A255H4T4_9ACTN|nr:ATP-binding protein [Enemella dayhoffiae]OYO22688.1 ATP-binding protein [Enemella dayhoffiae]
MPSHQLARSSADASPTKAFFVRMLTRDISLDDCILDLIDNSIDSAWQHAGVRPTAFTPSELLKEYRIDIEFDETSFRISDNCGGISLDNAADYAFTFGRKDGTDESSSAELEGGQGEDEDPDSDPSSPDYSVGVYGIGMKRAIFKIGNDITITTTHSDRSSSDSFAVPIMVKEWLADTTTPWDFDIVPAEPLSSPGVVIDVTDLNEESKRRFADPAYEQTLRSDILRRDYMIPLMQGLTITVNGNEVGYRPISLLASEDFTPLRETIEDGQVTIEIIAGMHAAPPDDNEPDGSRQDRDSGWYVVCNGRVVLAADRTTSTGWGVKGFPQWHGQYSGFIGIVLFSAADPSLLPMTTTKRNVDVSSAVYQRTVNQMMKPTRSWIDYTNARKTAIERAKKFEESAKPIEASSVAENASVVLPKITTKRTRVANINYSVPLAKMKSLAEALGDAGMSYRDVGLASFEYTYNDHVDDDE